VVVAVADVVAIPDVDFVQVGEGNWVVVETEKIVFVVGGMMMMTMMMRYPLLQCRY